MFTQVEFRADAPRAVVRQVLRSLDSYPDWLDIVAMVSTDSDRAEAWVVQLTASVGPLKRSKQLRMRRVVDEDATIQFVRDELDDRRHSPWEFTIHLADVAPNVTDVRFELAYGGSLWVPMLDPLVATAIDRARPKLAAAIAAAVAP